MDILIPMIFMFHSSTSTSTRNGSNADCTHTYTRFTYFYCNIKMNVNLFQVNSLLPLPSIQLAESVLYVRRSWLVMDVCLQFVWYFYFCHPWALKTKRLVFFTFHLSATTSTHAHTLYRNASLKATNSSIRKANLFSSTLSRRIKCIVIAIKKCTHHQQNMVKLNQFRVYCGIMYSLKSLAYTVVYYKIKWEMSCDHHRVRSMAASRYIYMPNDNKANN